MPYSPLGSTKCEVPKAAEADVLLGTRAKKLDSFSLLLDV